MTRPGPETIRVLVLDDRGLLRSAGPVVRDVRCPLRRHLLAYTSVTIHGLWATWRGPEEEEWLCGWADESPVVSSWCRCGTGLAWRVELQTHAVGAIE